MPGSKFSKTVQDSSPGTISCQNLSFPVVNLSIPDNVDVNEVDVPQSELSYIAGGRGNTIHNNNIEYEFFIIADSTVHG